MVRTALLFVLGAIVLAGCGDGQPARVRLLIPRNTVAAYLPIEYWLWDEWSRPLVRLPEGEVIRLPAQFWNQTPWSEPELFPSQEACLRRRAEIVAAFGPEEPVRWRLGHSRCVRAS
ncbi:MAG TPA: hypothetical protein VN646_10845 [Candidatus Acidoferrum sp.]|jgi:hypothetical protein|nr:hypothetical protein [Candidatus Acidoferrum sp.]